MTLVDPAPSELLRTWPSINTNNLDELDSLIGSPALRTYVPIVSGMELGTDPELSGHFCSINGYVYVTIRINVGTNPNPGTQILEVSIPVPYNPLLVADTGRLSVGYGQIFDASVSDGRHLVFCYRAGSSAFRMRIQENGLTVQGDVPFTWSDQDIIEVRLRYLA